MPWIYRNVAEPSLRLIAGMTAKVCDVSIECVLGHDTRRGVVRARQMAHLIAHRITSRSLAAIGYYIGRTDHGTVLYGVHAAEDRVKEDADVAALHQRILALIVERHAAEMAARPKVRVRPKVRLRPAGTAVRVAAGGAA